jgi:hypothetical protein
MFAKNKTEKESKVDLKKMIESSGYNNKLYYKPFVLTTDKRVFLAS